MFLYVFAVWLHVHCMTSKEDMCIVTICKVTNPVLRHYFTLDMFGMTVCVRSGIGEKCFFCEILDRLQLACV